MKNVRFQSVCMFAILILLSSCWGGREKESGKKDDGKVTIGFSIATDTFIIERWNKDIKIFTTAAKNLGAEVILQLSAGGAKAQIDQIHYLLEKDIDILVVLAHDTSLLAGAIKEVRDRRIPVLAYDRLIMGVPVNAYISFDNREVGRLFGKALTAKVPRGNYLIVNGSIRDNNSYEVNDGLHEIIDPYIEAGQINIVDELWLEQWSGDEAAVRVREVLERTTDIDAISAGNDQIANAAIQLLAERRMAGDVAVVGQDADLLSCQRVVEGLQLMTVYKPIEKLASRAAALSVELAKGEMPDPDRMIENDSGVKIPFFVEMPRAVFKENMDETVIRDGFHSVEDVYRDQQGEF
ncbi:substrate-binding domain-containing protein [Sediminispirochaeta bajacaliforniensis]|uniref:substrate-binding domain-containing protein n=1 Tax=Sediminispirochaeta bajacaliforniensis TaxID=148 RepID=UPI000527B4D7